MCQSVPLPPLLIIQASKQQSPSSGQGGQHITRVSALHRTFLYLFSIQNQLRLFLFAQLICRPQTLFVQHFFVVLPLIVSSAISLSLLLLISINRIYKTLNFHFTFKYLQIFNHVTFKLLLFQKSLKNRTKI